MKLNTYILKDYLDMPVEQAILHSDPLERNLEMISFYENQAINTSSIYIINGNDLSDLIKRGKTGTFLCIGRIDSSNIPSGMDVLMVSSEISIFSAYHKLQNVFQRFYNFEKDLYQLEETDAPLKLFGNCALPFLYNPITMYTPSHRMIFFSERDKEKQLQFFHEEEVNAFLPDEDIDVLKLDSEFISTIDSTKPEIFSEHMWGYQILYYNIRISDIYVARIMLCEIDRPLKESDACILMFLSEYVKRMMQKQNLTLNNHPQHFDPCIMKLLQREEIEPFQIQQALSEMQWNTDDRCFCALIRISSYDQAIHTESAVSCRLEATLPGTASLLLDDYILLIANLRQGKTTKEQVLMSLAYILREGLLKAGVSNEFDDFHNLADYYDQAHAALHIGSKLDETIWCYHYEQYALQYLLDRAAGEHSTRSLCPPGLIKLMEYDKKHQRSLTKALQVFLEQNMNIAKTIRILYLQRATFLYQLQRIREISELDLDDMKVRLELRIVFAIMKVRECE